MSLHADSSEFRSRCWVADCELQSIFHAVHCSAAPVPLPARLVTAHLRAPARAPQYAAADDSSGRNPCVKWAAEQQSLTAKANAAGIHT